MVDIRRFDAEDLLYFYDDAGWLTSVRRSWTDDAETDPLLELSRGQALFRVDDLLALASLIDGSCPPAERERSGEP